MTLFALLASGAFGALRVGPKDAAPFLLQELEIESGIAWYDAEIWLTGLNGEVQFSSNDRKIYWRKGKTSGELGVAAPYVTVNGKPVAPADPPRMMGARIAVSERFIKLNGPVFAGIDFKTGPADARLNRRVVIDPAYGGDDPGPRTVDQVQAKKITLAVAKSIAESFLKEGYEVRLTRTDDVPVNVSRRAAVANNWGSDIFLSVQISGDKRPLAKGFEVFFPAEPSPDADHYRWDAAQKGVAERSRKWAAEVKSAAGSALPMPNRGTAELMSPLLSAIDCPAALLVVGNANSQQEMEILIGETSRVKLADAIVDAANRFLSR